MGIPNNYLTTKTKKTNKNTNTCTPPKKKQPNTHTKNNQTTKNMYANLYGHSVYFPLPTLRIA